MRLSMFAGEVSAPAFTIEIRRSSPYSVSASFTASTTPSVNDHEPVAGFQCHGSYLVDCVGLDSKRKATHIETLDQS